MPLYNKQRFEPCRPPENVSPDTLVFHCKITNEVFSSHEEYYNQMIKLSSTGWTCSLTRKSNLTYLEALKSEEEAQKELEEYPEYLERPILLLVHKYTNRGRFEELVHDIYHIMKDRYFINEEVSYMEKNRKYAAEIVTSCTVEDQEGLENHKSPAEIKEPVLQCPDVYRYTIKVLGIGISEADRFREGVTHDKLLRSKNVGARHKVRFFLKNTCHIPPDGERYTIKNELIKKIQDIWWTDVMSGAEPICPQTPAQQKGRVPNSLKPDYVEPEKKEKKPRKEKTSFDSTPRPRGRPPQTPEQRALKTLLKGSNSRKRNEAGQDLTAEDFDLTQSGALTLNVPSTSSASPAKKKVRRNTMSKADRKKAKIQEQQDDLNFYFNEARRLGIDISGLEQDEKLLSPKKVSEFKQKVKEEKDVERDALKEEKKRKLREKAAYNRKREDLICNDLKPMPKFPALELPTWMTNEEFGDFIFIMQFFSSFKDILPLKEIRGKEDVPFSDIILAIKCNDPQNSPLADLLRVLLSVRTDIAEEEDGDEVDYNNREESYLINTQNCDPINVTHGDSIRNRSDIHLKIRKTHGKSVRHLPVDWMTLTEVLRLIFETSGYYTGSSTHRHRLYARGNFRGYEDPAYELKQNRPDIMEKLLKQTIFDLEPCERLEIVKTLMYQLLTYSKFRTHLENGQSELSELRREQKRLKNWDSTQEGEFGAARLLLELDAVHDLESKETPVAKKLKGYLKAHNEGRRYDRSDMESILMNSVPYNCLTMDEVVTARELQKAEYGAIMDDLISKLFTSYCKVSDIRLGNDRAYRRYIVIENLSVILIENPTTSELCIECDEPTVIDDANNLEENEHQEVFRCTGNFKSCLVHGVLRNECARWSYIDTREKFNQLLECLNPRGCREVELLEDLNEYRLNLLDIIEKTEKSNEDGTWKEMLMTFEPDPADSYNIDWDAELRDLLLDFEEKIDQGLLGSIEKVFKINRIAWRTSLKDHGNVDQYLENEREILNEFIENPDEIVESQAKKLATAFFMIIKSINLKFVKAPFISPNKDERGKLKGSELFGRWQRSLLQCESFSALSLFISTFEGSIQWDKSRLQGKCKSCRRKAAAHELVLCSECNTCYHLKCAKLGNSVKDLPTDWMCVACNAQKRKVENEAKRLKLLDSEQEDISLNNMSIDDDDSPTFSNSQNIIKTASGRAVKKVVYSEVHDGTLKHKSNGFLSGSAPSTPSTRPHRNVPAKLIEEDNDDENDSDEENPPRKRKVPVSRKNTPLIVQDSPRSIPVGIKEKMTAIEQLLKEAMRQECSWPFLAPVDTKEVPDYYDVIKRPMDLRTMMNKIKQRIYNKPVEIRSDFQLILSNCETYNETESVIYELSQQLDQFVTSRLDAIIDQ